MPRTASARRPPSATTASSRWPAAGSRRSRSRTAPLAIGRAGSRRAWTAARPRRATRWSSEAAVGAFPTSTHRVPVRTITDAALRYPRLNFALPCRPSYARCVALSGNLSETSFTDLIQFYSISRQTAAVTIVSPAGPEHDVVVFMENGEIVDARFGPMTGIDAVRRAMRLCEGEFHVDLNVTTEKRTIWESCNKLLLEEMVSTDETNGVGDAPDASAEGPEE